MAQGDWVGDGARADDFLKHFEISLFWRPSTKNISHYFERWSRNSSSQALENDFKSQGEKRAKIVDRYRWQHSDLNALEMAKDIMPKNDSILSIVSVELWAYKWRETLKRKFTAIKKSKSDTITSRTFSLPMLPHAHFHRATITEQIKTLSDYALCFSDF